MANADTESKNAENTSDENQEFFQQWIINLLKNIDAQLDETSRIQLMEANGRDCARRESIKLAKECRGNPDKFLDRMKEWVDIRKEGNVVHFTYNKCFCPLVQAGPLKLSDTFCHCSCGWLKEMFETVVGKPVKVELLESIKRGSKACRFIIRV